ncbi:HlyD family efflux transporter periplasmic adaptor subunit [Actinomycetes bacterium KLBMP 9797]
MSTDTGRTEAIDTGPPADPAAKTTEIPLPRPPGRSEQTYAATSRRQDRKRRRWGGFLRGLRTTLVVLVLLAAAVAGGVYITRDRLAARAFLTLDHAVLTAQAVPVGTAAAGTVASVRVAPQRQVSEGDELARVRVSGPDGEPQTEVLTAPISGIVSDVDVPAGGVATPGQPVVTLYDPARLSFRADASVEELRELRLGMTARITADGLADPIDARLERVVPQVGDQQSDGAFVVVLVPDDSEAKTVRTLVPGLPFTATVDTNTAADGTPAVNSAR